MYKKSLFFILFFLTLNSSAQIPVILDSQQNNDVTPKLPKEQKKTFSKTFSIKIIQQKEDSSFLPLNTISYSKQELKGNPKSDFLHLPTGKIFPYHFEKFTRKKIKTRNDKDIQVKYSNSKGVSIFINLFYDPEGNDQRLKKYFCNKNKLINKSYPVQYQSYWYKVNGLETPFLYNTKKSVYECGSWILSIKITSKLEKNSDYIEKINTSLIQYFNPASLVELKPLNLKPNLEFYKKNLKNSDLLPALWASAMAKIDWAKENVDEKERTAGFPNNYLDMHVVAIENFLSILAKNSFSLNPKSKHLYRQLSLLQTYGYLADFLWEQNQGLLILSENTQLDTDNYKRWKKDNSIDIKWDTSKYYNIIYRNLDY